MAWQRSKHDLQTLRSWRKQRQSNSTTDRLVSTKLQYTYRLYEWSEDICRQHKRSWLYYVQQSYQVWKTAQLSQAAMERRLSENP